MSTRARRLVASLAVLAALGGTPCALAQDDRDGLGRLGGGDPEPGERLGGDVPGAETGDPDITPERPDADVGETPDLPGDSGVRPRGDAPQPEIPELPGTPRRSGGPRGKVPEGTEWPSSRDDVEVERPDEIERIKAELERIRQERIRVTGEGLGTLEESRVRDFAPAELSPVLAPRQEVVHLSLREAIGEALANNPDYLIRLYAARAAAEEVPFERGAFDPVLTNASSYGKAREPSLGSPLIPGGRPEVTVIPSETLAFQTAVAWRLPTGTQLQVSWNEARRITQFPFVITGNRSWTPNLGFRISQPLMRGFGWDVNLAPLHIAENRALQSDAELTATYMAAVVTVEEAYWNLVRAEEELRFQERSLSSAMQFLEDQRRREEAGAGTKLEVTIAKAGVAQRREAVIVAENALESARDQIIRLTRPTEDAGKWDLFVVPIDLPNLIPEPTLDAAAAIQSALERRPDYWQSLLALDTTRRQLKVAENGVLPQLNAFATWEQEGLGQEFGQAWDELGSGRFYSWSVGFEVELPFFLRSERARYRATKQLVAQAEASLRALEATVVLEVRGAIRDIRTAKARIEATRANRVLAEERLEATREMLNAGAAVPRDVLDDLAELAAAESAEIQAFINYRLSITRLRQAQGTILDDWLEALPARVHRTLQRDRILD